MLSSRGLAMSIGIRAGHGAKGVRSSSSVGRIMAAMIHRLHGVVGQPEDKRRQRKHEGSRDRGRGDRGCIPAVRPHAGTEKENCYERHQRRQPREAKQHRKERFQIHGIPVSRRVRRCRKGKEGAKQSPKASALQVVGPVDVDGGMVVVKVERDGQRHGGFGRGQQNDKQGDHLPVEPERG